jgi:dGTPase
VRLFSGHLDEVRKMYPALAERRVIHETIRRMINILVSDVIRQTEKNIQAQTLRDVGDVRNAPTMLAFSEPMLELNRELKAFLRTHLYRHYLVLRMSAKAQRIISELFQAFMEDRRLLPPQFLQATELNHARAVADYVAGMTDRYAIREYRRLFSVEEV